MKRLTREVHRLFNRVDVLEFQVKHLQKAAGSRAQDINFILSYLAGKPVKVPKRRKK